MFLKIFLPQKSFPQMTSERAQREQGRDYYKNILLFHLIWKRKQNCTNIEPGDSEQLRCVSVDTAQCWGAIKALTVIGTNSNYLIKSHLMSPNGSQLPTRDNIGRAKSISGQKFFSLILNSFLFDHFTENKLIKCIIIKKALFHLVILPHPHPDWDYVMG